jgi:hypothetical protein
MELGTSPRFFFSRSCPGHEAFMKQILQELSTKLCVLVMILHVLACIES